MIPEVGTPSIFTFTYRGILPMLLTLMVSHDPLSPKMNMYDSGPTLITHFTPVSFCYT